MHVNKESSTSAVTGNGNTEQAVLGGGCFWCTESVFQSLNGVLAVEPGYSGGHVDNPTYEAVCEKQTGHIEVVRLSFDPGVVSYETILRVFFATHDPTTPDQQGNDIGPQYASVIFWQSDAQRQVAERVITEVQQQLGQPVVSRLLPAERFWVAEAYHHDYYARNPYQGYCQFVIAPKLAKLRKYYADLLRRG
ncbi:MAG: peptide-methionine (S)-S-oxide reductase MsrA [Pusillimonas sp.]